MEFVEPTDNHELRYLVFEKTAELNVSRSQQGVPMRLYSGVLS